MTTASSSEINASHYRVNYTNNAKWVDFYSTAEFIRNKYLSFSNGKDLDQYLELRDVTSENIRELDGKCRFHRSLPTMRITYFERERALIVKLINEAHGLISQNVNEIIVRHCRSLGMTPSQLTVLGPSRQIFDNLIEKEPDESYKPDAQERAYPSFVVDVGASGYVDQLRTDANLWLKGTNGSTRGGLTVKIDKLVRTLIFKRWQMLPRPPYSRTRSSAEHVLDCAQTVTVDFDIPNGVSVTEGTTPLLIPTELICDVTPRAKGTLNGESAISLSAQDLFDIGSEYFSG